MTGKEIRLARLAKLKLRKKARLDEAFKSYKAVLNRASKINLKVNTNELLKITCDEDLMSFNDLYNIILALELFIYYDPLLKSHFHFFNSTTYPKFYDQLNRFFPFHGKHPNFETLLTINDNDLQADQTSYRQNYAHKVKQALYSAFQCKIVNNFTRSAKKNYTSLKTYIHSLYRHYPTLGVVETAIYPILDLTILKETELHLPSLSDIATNQEMQQQLSNYATVRQSYQVFLKQLAEHPILGAQYVGYFWKLRHSVLTGYFYQLVIFFEERKIAGRLCSGMYTTNFSMDSRLTLMPFKLLDRLDLQELIAGIKLVDSYLKLNPVDASTGKAYPNDRTFGKAEFRPNNPRVSSVKKQPDWQPL